MKRYSYQEIIINYLKEAYYFSKGGEAAWVNGYNLEKVDTRWGWIGVSGMRRARELAQAGRIETRIKDGYVQYRYLPPKPLSHEQQEAEQLQRLIISTG